MVIPMKTSVHISTDMVKVVSYTKSGTHITVKDYSSYPLPEECMLSGVILDVNPILEALRSLKSANQHLFKETSLVIDGNFVYSKKITIPNKLNKLMCDEIIRDEFSEISTDSENLICDYSTLGYNSDGSKNILACAIESSHAQSYISLFNAADIKLTSLHLGIFTVLQFVSSITKLEHESFVLNLVDDVVMLSMIFQNGDNVFQSRTRLYGDDRSALVNGTLDELSGIIQFNRSQNFDEIKYCYYLGLTDSDMEEIIRDTSYPEISFSKLNLYKNAKKAEILPPNAHFAYFNALMPDSKNDILYCIKMLNKAKQLRQPKRTWIPVLAAVFIMVATTITGLWILTSSVERDIREINEFLEAPYTVAERNRLEELDFNTTHITTLYESAIDMQGETDSEHNINRQILDSLMNTAGEIVEINGINFNYSNGTITVSCSSSTEYDASAFVELLRTNSMLTNFNVYYTGYATGADGVFIFSIDVVIPV
ncbi:MAG: pilus assembly protein PilM [Oscillospiraceae bacterium]|nr:pilus assembly protein PilM [Oscillospiraceae bacterium]